MTAARPITAAQYRRAWDRLYTQSMRANSAEECAAIDAKLAQLNARPRKAAV